VEHQKAERYTAVAIVLHWLIALAVLAMIPMGLWMSEAITDPAQQQAAYRIFQLHKSIGFAILALTLVRLAWRLGHPVPALPSAMPPWERFGARATHAAFYALLILMPLTGWAYVSTGWSVGYDQPLNVATSWFGLFGIPHLPGFADAAAEVKRTVAFRSMGAHSLMGLGAIILVVLHIGAALKHQLKDKDGVVAGMAPWLKTNVPGEVTPNRGRMPVFAGTGLIVLVLMIGGLLNTPKGALKAAAPADTSAPSTISQTVTPGTATAWTVDKAASSIAFTGNHAGKDFAGRFPDWDGHIWFDPNNLSGSKVVVLVRTGSVITGDATQEGSLREPEWFDPEAAPVARFEASNFRALGGDRYEASGALFLKDRNAPVVLPFTLSITGDQAKASGTLELDRTALNMGMISDPAAEWVSQMIGVSVTVSARRGGRAAPRP
jgi:cytochrome b561